MPPPEKCTFVAYGQYFCQNHIENFVDPATQPVPITTNNCPPNTVLFPNNKCYFVNTVDTGILKPTDSNCLVPRVLFSDNKCYNVSRYGSGFNML
jgi:hypothetical protein